MIAEKDLKAAIAECQGERNPTANTCIKLAAYYTILKEISNSEKASQIESNAYSLASAPAPYNNNIIDYYSDTEFSEIIDGKNSMSVWRVMDELMSTLQAIQPRLYNGVIRKLREI